MLPMVSSTILDATMIEWTPEPQGRMYSGQSSDGDGSGRGDEFSSGDADGEGRGDGHGEGWMVREGYGSGYGDGSFIDGHSTGFCIDDGENDFDPD